MVKARRGRGWNGVEVVQLAEERPCYIMDLVGKRTMPSILLPPLLLEPQEILHGIDDADLQIDICPFLSKYLVALFSVPARWVHIVWEDLAGIPFYYPLFQFREVLSNMIYDKLRGNNA